MVSSHGLRHGVRCELQADTTGAKREKQDYVVLRPGLGEFKGWKAGQLGRVTYINSDGSVYVTPLTSGTKSVTFVPTAVLANPVPHVAAVEVAAAAMVVGARAV